MDFQKNLYSEMLILIHKSELISLGDICFFNNLLYKSFLLLLCVYGPNLEYLCSTLYINIILIL